MKLGLSQVMNLYRRLGKPIPDIKLPAGTEITTTLGGRKVGVSAPRITFVGGQKLTSTGTAESTTGPPKVYPPGAPAAAPAAAVKVEKEGAEETAEEAPEIEPVG